MAESQSHSDQAPVPGSLVGSVFVGRQREMDELKAALEDALSGRGRLVMLVGEPGIGQDPHSPGAGLPCGDAGLPGPLGPVL